MICRACWLDIGRPGFPSRHDKFFIYTLVLKMYMRRSLKYFVGYVPHFGKCTFSVPLILFTIILERNWIWLGDAMILEEFTMNRFRYKVVWREYAPLVSLVSPPFSALLQYRLSFLNAVIYWVGGSFRQFNRFTLIESKRYRNVFLMLHITDIFRFHTNPNVLTIFNVR